jgi:hypothetical protein
MYSGFDSGGHREGVAGGKLREGLQDILIPRYQMASTI